MATAYARWPRIVAIVLVLSAAGLVRVAQAGPVTLEYTGPIFEVSDPDDVFLTTVPDFYSLLITWDPDLLVGMPLGGTTYYETAPGETSITFSFLSGAGDSFTSDNSFPVRVGIENTPPVDWSDPMPGTGEDYVSIHGFFAPNLEFNLVMAEAIGSNPLSSNALPTTAFGSGPGTWETSELDIDRTDLFANISGSVSDIQEVRSVPDQSSPLVLSGIVMMILVVLRNRIPHAG